VFDFPEKIFEEKQVAGNFCAEIRNSGPMQSGYPPSQFRSGKHSKRRQAALLRYHLRCHKKGNRNMNQEDRMVDIEIRLARQDDMLDELNKLVYRQQLKIDQLEALCTALARRIKDAADNSNAGQVANERPPHY
jgi:SlyX protein